VRPASDHFISDFDISPKAESFKYYLANPEAKTLAMQIAKARFRSISRDGPGNYRHFGHSPLSPSI
jgi:hypothetical protein